MPYVIEMYFDSAAEALVQRLWAEVAKLKIVDPPPPDARPHVSLGIWETLALDPTRSVLESFTEELSGLELVMRDVGSFDMTGVVYLAPEVTPKLVEAHAKLHRLIAPFTTDPREYYLPGRWTPHCTLADKLSAFDLPKVMHIGRSVKFPLRATIESCGIVIYPGAIPQCDFLVARGPAHRDRRTVAQNYVPNDLSEALRPLAELELSLGNRIAHVTRESWSSCPLSITFAQPLHTAQINQLLLSRKIEKWENRDTHYPLEAGYRCPQSHHSIAGPLT